MVKIIIDKRDNEIIKADCSTDENSKLKIGFNQVLGDYWIEISTSTYVESAISLEKKDLILLSEKIKELLKIYENRE